MKEPVRIANQSLELQSFHSLRGRYSRQQNSIAPSAKRQLAMRRRQITWPESTVKRSSWTVCLSVERSLMELKVSRATYSWPAAMSVQDSQISSKSNLILSLSMRILSQKFTTNQNLNNPRFMDRAKKLISKCSWSSKFWCSSSAIWEDSEMQQAGMTLSLICQ